MNTDGRRVTALARGLAELRAAAGTRAALLFAGNEAGQLTCVCIEGDPGSGEANLTDRLAGVQLRRDQMLAHARRQNRPFTVAAGDLLLVEPGSNLAAAEAAPWAIVIPLYPGRGLEAWIVLLCASARSLAEVAALAKSASRIAALVADTSAADSEQGHTGAAASARAETEAVNQPVLALPLVPPAADLRSAPDDIMAGIALVIAVARDGVVFVDSAGKVGQANEIGRELLSILQPDQTHTIQHEALSTLIAAARAVPSHELELTAGRESPRFINAAASRIPGSESVVLSLRDVARERMLHERLLQSEKMASVGQLVSGVAHELNNPLTGIMGFAQLLLMRDLGPEVHREITTIHDEAERAAHIVQNLLSFSRQRSAQRERVDLNGLIERVIELRSYEFRVRNIRTELNLPPSLPPIVADPHQVQQVLLNVIGNAEHAIQHRAGGLICCSTAVQDGAITLAITDSGVGISAQHLRRVFDPFFTTKEVGEGTGLGLAICYGIVTDHGGEIAIDSELGRGTTVTIRLPMASTVLPETPAPKPLRAAAAAPRSRILVVDDELSIRALLHASLSADGHHVDTAGDGVGALEYLAENDVDLIISDVKMPGVDGIEFYRRVKAWNPAVAARIVFTSGDLLNPQTQLFLDSIPNLHVAKPFDLGAMQSLIDAVLSS